MQTHEAIHYQRVNTPLTTENLDATKIVPRPPSRAIKKPTKQNSSVSNVDLITSREGYFSGTATSINSRLIHLADIGRCDLYGRSGRCPRDSDYALPKREMNHWFTISSEDMRKKKQTRLSNSSDNRLINEFKTPPLKSIIAGDEPLPFSINPSFLVDTIDVNVDNIRYKKYTINLLNKSHGFIVDTWWWIYLDRFCLKSENRLDFSKADLEKARNKLMFKISDKFINIVFESERLSQRDFMGNCHVQFFRQLAKLMALVIYSGFCHAWMNDRPIFVNAEFHQYLLDRFSLWIEGIRHMPQRDQDVNWRRVEPPKMRKNQASSNQSNSKGSKGAASMNCDFRTYLESQTGEGQSTRWQQARTRFTVMKNLGQNMRDGDGGQMSEEMASQVQRRMSQRRKTVASRGSIKTEDMLKLRLSANSHSISDERTVTFHSSKFDVNGCSPLFELAFPSNKTQTLVSRRSCAPKEKWRENPLVNSAQHIATAKGCVKRVKKVLNKTRLGRP